MTKLWNAKTEKATVAIGAGVAGYSILTTTAFTTLPALPNFVTNPLLGGISLLTIAGGLAVYSVYMMLSKF